MQHRPTLLVNPERLPLALGAGQFVEAIAEVEPYPLAEEHKGRCAVKVTLYTAEGSGVEEKPFISKRDFESEQEARQHGEKLVASLGGTLCKTP